MENIERTRTSLIFLHYHNFGAQHFKSPVMIMSSDSCFSQHNAVEFDA